MARMTLTLEVEVLARLRKYAQARSMSVGDAVCELVRRGLDACRAAREVNGLYVLDLSLRSPAVTAETVKRLDADEP